MRPLKNIGNTCAVDSLLTALILSGCPSQHPTVELAREYLFSSNPPYYPLRYTGNLTFKELSNIIEPVVSCFKNVEFYSGDINEQYKLDKFKYLIIPYSYDIRPFNISYLSKHYNKYLQHDLKLGEQIKQLISHPSELLDIDLSTSLIVDSDLKQYISHKSKYNSILNNVVSEIPNIPKDISKLPISPHPFPPNFHPTAYIINDSNSHYFTVIPDDNRYLIYDDLQNDILFMSPDMFESIKNGTLLPPPGGNSHIPVT